MSPDFGWDGDEGAVETDDAEGTTVEAGSPDPNPGVGMGDTGPSGVGTTETDTTDAWGSIRRAYADADTDDRDARERAVEQLREEHNLVYVRDNETLYRYDPEAGIYRDDGADVVGETLQSGLGKYNRRREASEIEWKLEQGEKLDLDEFGPKGLVCLENGVLDLRDLTAPTLRPHSPNHLFLCQRPVEYDSSAECPRFEAFVDEVVHGPDVDKLQEFVGYTVFHHWRLRYKKALLLLGDTDSGKSTFLNVVAALLGEENVSNQSFRRLARREFAAAQLQGMLANTYNDLDTEVVEHVGMFKSITGNDPIPAEKKYKPEFTFRPTAKLLFAANDVPNVENRGRAFHNRWLHIEFPERIPEEEQNKDLEAELEEELPGVLNWALEGYQRLRTNDGFTGERSLEQKKEYWESNGDTVGRFLHNGPVKRNPEAEVPKETVYAVYEEWCEAHDRDFMPEDYNVFCRKLSNEHDIKGSYPTLDGDRVYCFKGLTLTGDEEGSS